MVQLRQLLVLAAGLVALVTGIAQTAALSCSRTSPSAIAAPRGRAVEAAAGAEAKVGRPHGTDMPLTTSSKLESPVILARPLP